MLPKSQMHLTSMTDASIIKWNNGSIRVRKSLSPDALRARVANPMNKYRTDGKFSYRVSEPTIHASIPAKPNSHPRLVKAVK